MPFRDLGAVRHAVSCVGSRYGLTIGDQRLGNLVGYRHFTLARVDLH